MTVETSMQYVNQEAIQMGIANLVPMRMDIRLPPGADWKTPYDKLARMFRIYQYEKGANGECVVPYGTHDLYFWCMSDPVEGRDLRYSTLSFNDARSIAERYADMERLAKAVPEVFADGEATVQYHDEYDKKAVHEMAERRFEELQGKRVTCPSREADIVFLGLSEPVGRLVRYKGGIDTPFAFKRLRSRKYVYPRTEIDICFAKEAVA